MPRPAHVHRKSVETQYDGHRVSVTKTETVELDTRLGLPFIGPGRMARSAQASLPSSSSSRRGSTYTSDCTSRALEGGMGRLAIADGWSDTPRPSRSSHASESSRRSSRGYGRGRDDRESIFSDTSSHRSSNRSRVRTLLSSVISKATGSTQSWAKSERDSSTSSTARPRPSTSAGVGYPRPADGRRTSGESERVCYYSSSDSDDSIGTLILPGPPEEMITRTNLLTLLVLAGSALAAPIDPQDPGLQCVGVAYAEIDEVRRCIDFLKSRGNYDCAVGPGKGGFCLSGHALILGSGAGTTKCQNIAAAAEAILGSCTTSDQYVGGTSTVGGNSTIVVTVKQA
ncbi:hypothetical protein BJY00DRAFT_308574 [Aspergillus carlsbadensis]|nr:hypothetical protein BJY00DRAFT_308574 [Aspergillus carlsbadensis]